MANSKDKKKYESSTIWAMFFIGVWIGVAMGGTMVALITAKTLNDVDVAFERAIEIQKENNQFAIDLAVLEYRLNDSLSCGVKNTLQEEKIKEYKLIIQNMHSNYNNQDERFEKMLESYLEVREEVQNLNYQYALCYEGIAPHRKEFNQ